MVLVQFAVDSEGQFLGNTKNIKESMHHWMRDLWQGMVDDGSITQVRCIQKKGFLTPLDSILPFLPHCVNFLFFFACYVSRFFLNVFGNYT